MADGEARAAVARIPLARQRTRRGPPRLRGDRGALLESCEDGEVSTGAARGYASALPTRARARRDGRGLHGRRVSVRVVAPARGQARRGRHARGRAHAPKRRRRRRRRRRVPILRDARRPGRLLPALAPPPHQQEREPLQRLRARGGRVRPEQRRPRDGSLRIRVDTRRPDARAHGGTPRRRRPARHRRRPRVAPSRRPRASHRGTVASERRSDAGGSVPRLRGEIRRRRHSCARRRGCARVEPGRLRVRRRRRADVDALRVQARRVRAVQEPQRPDRRGGPPGHASIRRDRDESRVRVRAHDVRARADAAAVRLEQEAEQLQRGDAAGGGGGGAQRGARGRRGDARIDGGSRG